MKKINISFLLILFLLIIGCQNNDNTLTNELAIIEKQIPPKILDDFSRRNEIRALGYVSIDRDSVFRIQNKRINDNIALKKFFESKGISGSRNILTIVYTSLHRKLNSRKINLDSQINEIVLSIKNSQDCIKWQKQTLNKNNSLSVNDTVLIRLKIDDNKEWGYPNECYDPNWHFDDNEDLLIKALIKKKYSYEYIDSSFIIVEIIQLNKNDIKMLGKIAKTGDEFELDLSYNIITKLSALNDSN